ncbi:MAG: nucleotidyltransferase domain-containing protein [Bacteroidales bacterium]|jgi:predicted nucleotidyltransferase|nr:nucleotidyltransferase domain-containing protein [Bacteroidales bacterium]
MHTIVSILSNYDEVKQVLIFGSRAKGSYHTGSDIDMAIMGNTVWDETLRNIKNDFDDSSLLYNVDIVNFETLTNEDLKNHILRVGKLIYSVDALK